MKNKNEIYLNFSIRNFESITHDEITRMIGIEPIKIHIKGNRRNPKNEFSPLITKNNWFMGSGLDKYVSFDEHLNALMDVLESKIDIFQLICTKYECVFICAFYIYKGNGESTPWVHLDDRYNQLIKKLNIGFDLDIYVW